ncbi:MAG: methanogen output domain 1-containing protein [Bdellovibrionota bacterium]
MNALPEKQQKILDLLITNPNGLTADQVADHLGVTKTAAKEHLNKLEYLEYLNFRDEKGIVGRPKRFYLLSHRGGETFPRQYSWLSNLLLAYLSEDLGSAKVSSIMKKIADQVADSVSPRLQGLSEEARTNEVIKIMNELGYKAKASGKEKDSSRSIEAINCVYHNVAKEHPELCGFDIRLLENMTGKNIKLESCIARGASTCRFCLK